MADSARRIELGFDGGQVIALRVSEKDLEALRKALGGDGWHRLSTEESEVDVDLGKLVFVKTAGDGTKVGF
ncbi:MAG: hypothetical protein U0R24_02315 [Solirubrobacterales bacterium]|mgnify:CR=1 FL=1